MKYAILAIFSIVFWSAVSFAQQEKSITVGNMPPSVVKTVPPSGDVRVDPSMQEIRVTFSKAMMTDRMWSWVMDSKATFPEINAEGIHFLEDNRTCVLPVKLEPNRTYVIWINSQKFNAFRDQGNRAAIPYLLVFETKE
jgi:RNA polymerase sigma-70 factor (ECF subfamily)